MFNYQESNAWREYRMGLHRIPQIDPPRDPPQQFHDSSGAVPTQFRDSSGPQHSGTVPELSQFQDSSGPQHPGTVPELSWYCCVKDTLVDP